MFDDGWVCRACWKPNRADETACYRCKTPRDAQKAVEAGSKVAVLDPLHDKRGRLDIEWPVLARLVSWPLGFDGAFGLLGGFLGFAAGGLLTGTDETILGMDLGTFVMIVAIVSLALSAARIFVARSIQRFARWAYSVAIALTALGSFPYLVGLLPDPYDAGSLSASFHMLRVVLNLLMFFGAIALLAMSYVRQPVSDAAASPPPEPIQPTPAAAAGIVPSAGGRVVFTSSEKHEADRPEDHRS